MAPLKTLEHMGGELKAEAKATLEAIRERLARRPAGALALSEHREGALSVAEAGVKGEEA